MPRIAITLPDLRSGGVERIRLTLAHEFVRRGYTVEFVLREARGELLAEAQAAFDVVDLGASRMRDVPRALSAYLRRRTPTALLAAMWPLTVAAPIAVRLSGRPCPVLVSEHNTLSLQYAEWSVAHRLLLRTSIPVGYRLARARVGVSKGVARDMARLSGLASSQIAVIHNPLVQMSSPDTARISAANALWRTDGPRILTVGNLKPVKNHALLLRAFARLDRPGAQLMLLGQGQEEARLRTLAQELGIADRVVFVGFQSDPAAFYATADLFVLSSKSEGFGNVLVEALSFSLPIVSTDCPSGPAEILEEGRWGRLVPVGEPEALAQAMREALSGPTDREALRRRAADFSPEIVAGRYLDLLGLA